MRKGWEERFWAKVETQPDTECCVWTAAHRGEGRKRTPMFFIEGQTISAKRFIFTKTRGEIPEGHQVHSRCKTPKCVNPEHMYLRRWLP